MSENFENTYSSSISNQDFWDYDGISLIGSSNSSPDSITFSDLIASGSEFSTGFGNNITSKSNSNSNSKMIENSNVNGFWKYNEDKILKQLEQYISSTYSQHYVDETGGVKQQTLDKIKYNRREGFCAGNVTKYIDRYDTKGTPRADLFKVLHYTILLINHLNLIENK
jgi:hypothetical protein